MKIAFQIMIICCWETNIPVKIFRKKMSTVKSQKRFFCQEVFVFSYFNFLDFRAYILLILLIVFKSNDKEKIIRFF